MEQLPTNLLIKIFENLKNSDLIALSCTCKKFLEVVTDFMAIKYPAIKVDFQNLSYTKHQKFTCKDGKDFNVLIETSRRYQNYILLNFNKENTDRVGNKWLQLFKTQINARTIRIKSDNMDLQQLISMLKLAHRLIYLEIDGYRFTNNKPLIVDDNERKLINLSSLRHLKIHSFIDVTPEFFEIFKGSLQLKTISLSGLFVNKKSESINDLICKQQSALEQLELIGLDTQNNLFDNIGDYEIKYELKKLNAEYNGYSMNLENFSLFVGRQKCLKEIKLTFDLRNSLNYINDIKLCYGIVAQILTLESLSSINIVVNKFALKEVNRPEFPQNRNVKRLVFENESRDKNNILIALLKSLPNLRSLELACDYDEEVLLELSQISKLKQLKLVDYHQGLLTKISCSQGLKSIILKYCYAKNSGSDWHQFLSSHPNISDIRIEHSIDFVDDVIVEIITGSCREKLNSFIMHESVAKNITENSLRSFQKHCPNLKYLKLTEKSINKRTQNKHQSFHDMLANVKCIILFYLICIFLFVILILLMVFEKI